MKKITTVVDLQKELKIYSPQSIGLVPTMGGLHDGHLSLVRRCQDQGDFCVVSLFLNPTQFNNTEDLEKYPSSLEEDLEVLEQEGVDIVFIPNYSEMYPDNYRFKMIETDYSQKFCGKDRPGHFDGVLTIVLKLL
ncbi:MAG: pantoate--beta-alanine ligase, partial [Pseudomonadota bacterium]